MPCTRLMPGSSPLARGAPAPDLYAKAPDGIIPACAGSTFHHHAKGREAEDHPRLRGEHAAYAYLMTLPEGSSPLARGAPQHAVVAHRDAGIIPACAGSTYAAGTWCKEPWDHPRLRGEHKLSTAAEVVPPGSSPLARGAQPRRHPQRHDRGIIPACAGSTLLYIVRGRERRDHPRLRGEHATARGTATRRTGSSPLARGAHHQGLDAVARAGIIPACAGSTGVFVIGKGRERDHPRLRGEHLQIWVSSASVSGSSPLARGARHPRRRAVRRHGIIPACAGSTRPCRWGRGRGRDHPRLRAEDTWRA